MRVICMVPSLTETLIAAGVAVVGRTRFCIHPKHVVADIPVVGGTKDIDWQKVKNLRADLLILDQEENPKHMADESPIEYFATHVQDWSGLAKGLHQLSERLQVSQLREWSQQILVLQKKQWDWLNIPGVLQKIRQDHPSYEKLIYVIWQKPWMCVGPNTFIASSLKMLGAESYLHLSETSYPEFKMQDFDLQKTFFLFSSEPFPFEKQKVQLQALNVQGAIVDGESYSWFGIRALQFLKRQGL